MLKVRRRLMVILSVILIVAAFPLAALAGTDTNGGITFNYPGNVTECSPTFHFTTTGIDPSWPWQMDIYTSVSGSLVKIGHDSGTGNVNETFTPAALSDGQSQVYAAFLAVFVPGQSIPTKLDGQWRVDCNKPPTGGGEGCTPGFWKNHPDVWPIPTNTVFDSIFGRDAFNPDISMLDATNLKGGGLNALSRHAAAAYLNSISSVVNFDLTSGQVIADFQAAFDSGDYNATKDMFATLNELGCPY